MEELKPALIVDVDRDTGSRTGPAPGCGRPPVRAVASPVPSITAALAAARRAFDAMPAGPSAATLSLHVGEPKERATKVRNVVGLLRGSDPALKETYVLLTAHYDHLGIGPANGSGDRIFNGANDDGSGTVSVIEIASALATLKPRPKRSLVFLTFYGEEHGLVGSRYYVEHPVVPLEKTVADINLEQVGRTDDSDGPRVSAATVTGYDYSDVGPMLHRAGQAVGVDVLKHPTKSDSYFGASDNAAFATAGIPAHTISVAYMFPDYHGADDEWEKVDFANMAKVDRMAALGFITDRRRPCPGLEQGQSPGGAVSESESTVTVRQSCLSLDDPGRVDLSSRGRRGHSDCSRRTDGVILIARRWMDNSGRLSTEQCFDVWRTLGLSGQPMWSRPRPPLIPDKASSLKSK